MFNNKRPYEVNHIPHKSSYKYINKGRLSKKNSKKSYTKLKKISSNRIILSPPKDNILSENILDLDSNLKISSNQESTKFEEKIKKLEQKPIEFFESPLENTNNLKLIYNYLYHGLRFQKHLEKLESIFKNKAILAGNYQDNQYYSYSENCNEGEYISLTCIEEDYDLIYRTFIMPNISLVISSECKAIKTIYLSYEEWDKIKTIETKKRYSYANNEYQVKQIIPINMIKAIGLPSRYLRLTNQEYLIDIYKNDILELMNKYNIELPIVDTSNYNNVIYLPKEHISNHTLKRVK